MANVKNASIRENVIERCIQTRGGRTVPQIMEAYHNLNDGVLTQAVADGTEFRGGGE